MSADGMGAQGLSADGLRWWYADYLDACNRHDLAALRGFLDPDVRRAHRPAGADAWLDDLAGLLTAFPDLQWKRIQVLVEGDRIAAHLRARGTHRAAWASVPATGRRVNVAEFAFYRVAGGRIVEFTGGSDAELLAQLRA